MWSCKKIALIVLTAIIVCTAHAQDAYVNTIKEYYRVNPFEGSFAGFTKALSSDPELTDKKIVFKTDTSLFAISGTYKSFNPFYVKAKKVAVILAEEAITLGDTALTKDTIIQYQIIAWIAHNDTTKKLLMNEWERLNKRLRRSFSEAKEADLKGFQGVKEGKTIHYFWQQSILSPLTISWQTINNSNDLAITILARLRHKNGKAIPAGNLFDYAK